MVIIMESEREKFNKLLKTYKNKDFKYYTFFSQLHELFKKMCEVRKNKYEKKAAKKSDFYKNVSSNISMKIGESDFNLKEILKKKYSIWCAFKKKHRQAIKQIANEYADKLNDLFYNIYKLNEAIYNKINKNGTSYDEALENYETEGDNDEEKTINNSQKSFFGKIPVNQEKINQKQVKKIIPKNGNLSSTYFDKNVINLNYISKLFPTGINRDFDEVFEFIENKDDKNHYSFSLPSYVRLWFHPVYNPDKPLWGWQFKNLILTKDIHEIPRIPFQRGTNTSLNPYKNLKIPFNKS